ncbi:MAG TPA: RNA polymerase sigma factor [Ohtaekwangia sp.]|nr:RNA polymerase sigma factor [Ohtaekwangia sp.]
MKPLQILDFDSYRMHDSVVVRRVLAGEKELFEILLRRYNQKLYRVIRSYLKDNGDVEDAMQDTYLKAFDKLQQFEGNAAFSTWLIRIGINEALLRLRRLKKERSLYAVDDTLTEARLIQLPDNKQMNPEKLAIRHETKILIEQAIDQLPEKYRVIYVLKEVEGMDNSQIAELLQLSDANVKVRLHRAKTLLKDVLYKLSADSTIFEFGNQRCDAIVARVMKRL